MEQFQSQGPLHRMGTKAALSAFLPLCVLVGNPATWGPGWLPKPCPDSLSDESKYSSDLTSPTTHPTTRKTTVLNPNAHIPLLNVIYGKTNICFHRRRKLSTCSHPDLCWGASGTMRVALAVSHTQQLLHNMHYITQTITTIHFLCLPAQTDQSEPSMLG